MVGDGLGTVNTFTFALVYKKKAGVYFDKVGGCWSIARPATLEDLKNIYTNLLSVQFYINKLKMAENTLPLLLLLSLVIYERHEYYNIEYRFIFSSRWLVSSCCRFGR